MVNLFRLHRIHKELLFLFVYILQVWFVKVLYQLLVVLIFATLKFESKYQMDSFSTQMLKKGKSQLPQVTF